MSKKILIVSYYWPPSGGSGVQRWLKFAKYLPALGYETHVYAPENPDFSVIDINLENEIPKEVIVVKRPIKEPYVYYRALLGKKNTKGTNFGFTNSNKKSLAQQFAIWVRSNLFIPDARKWWVKPSVKFLKKYIVENNIDTIITTGPPHSMHLIGLGLKNEFGDKLNWIADFRDPWTRIYTNQELKISGLAQKKLENLERQVLKKCDKLITVSDFLKQEFEHLGAKGKSYAIYNGFDTSDYLQKDSNLASDNSDKKFVISYIGLFPGLSNPTNLWKSLKQIIAINNDFKNDLKIVLVGNIDNSILQDLEENDLMKFVELKGIVSHDEAVEFQKMSDLLLLCIPNVENSKGILTGKLFEYLASEKPIIAFGDAEGDVAEILKETKAGKLFSYQENTKVSDFVLQTYQAFKNDIPTVSNKEYLKYSRQELTKALAKVLEA